MTKFRQRSLKMFDRKPMAEWFAVNMPDIDFQDIYYFIRAAEKQGRDWDEVLARPGFIPPCVKVTQVAEPVGPRERLQVIAHDLDPVEHHAHEGGPADDDRHRARASAHGPAEQLAAGRTHAGEELQLLAGARVAPPRAADGLPLHAGQQRPGLEAGLEAEVAARRGRGAQAGDRGGIEIPSQKADLEIIEDIQSRPATGNRATAPFGGILDALHRQQRIDTAGCAGRNCGAGFSGRADVAKGECGRTRTPGVCRRRGQIGSIRSVDSHRADLSGAGSLGIMPVPEPAASKCAGYG